MHIRERIRHTDITEICTTGRQSNVWNGNLQNCTMLLPYNLLPAVTPRESYCGGLLILMHRRSVQSEEEELCVIARKVSSRSHAPGQLTNHSAQVFCTLEDPRARPKTA